MYIPIYIKLHLHIYAMENYFLYVCRSIVVYVVGVVAVRSSRYWNILVLKTNVSSLLFINNMQSDEE
jgi:hypothetical protein